MSSQKNDKSSNLLRIYFMGTGDVAIPVLDALAKSESVELVGVATQPDRPKGRKKLLTPSPVGEFAESIESLTQIDKPEKVRDPEFQNYLKSLNVDFIVVIAFGQILPQSLLDIPRFCCVNLHASILPKYRGASPINAAILAGDKETAITIMEMEAGLDSGPVHSVHKVTITEDDTYLSLEGKLARKGAEVIVDCLHGIASGDSFVDQDHDAATHVGKISKNDGKVDWAKSATELELMSRAYSPWPGLFFFMKVGKQERKITIKKITVLPSVKAEPGTEVQADKDGWVFACGEGAIRLDLIVPAGSREMSGADFLRGLQ